MHAMLLGVSERICEVLISLMGIDANILFTITYIGKTEFSNYSLGFSAPKATFFPPILVISAVCPMFPVLPADLVWMGGTFRITCGPCIVDRNGESPGLSITLQGLSKALDEVPRELKSPSDVGELALIPHSPSACSGHRERTGNFATGNH